MQVAGSRSTSTRAARASSVVPRLRRRVDGAADPRARARRRHRRRRRRDARSITSAAGRSTLDAIRVLVLDEADEMLDMGFAEDIDAILEATPATRQTALFSATMPARIAGDRRAAPDATRRGSRSRARRPRPASSRASARSPTSCARAHKAAALERVLDMESPASAHRLLPHAARGGHARRDAQRARLPRRGAARRHAAAAARRGDEPLPRRRRPIC